MSTIKTCLWFVSEAEQAASFYCALFPNSRVGNVMRGGDAVIAVDFVLDGSPITALNGRREPGFTDAASLMVPCRSQEEIDRYWDALVEGGSPGRCGWLTDRFGVSWQIIPENIGALLSNPDPANAGRAMQAMLGMNKLDIAALRDA